MGSFRNKFVFVYSVLTHHSISMKAYVLDRIYCQI